MTSTPTRCYRTAKTFTVFSAALLGLLVLPRAARATDPVPATPPPTLSAGTTSTWRSYAFPAALAATGASVASAITFKLVLDKRTDQFNQSVDPRCQINAADSGGPKCARLQDQADSASRWLKISAASAGAFAVAALVFKLTEPSSRESDAPRIACAPGLGASATCRLTF
ncbi:MAG TPA: hypothetical protein VGG33_05445 [Polyangia bacterium]